MEKKCNNFIETIKEIQKKVKNQCVTQTEERGKITTKEIPLSSRPERETAEKDLYEVDLKVSEKMSYFILIFP